MSRTPDFAVVRHPLAWAFVAVAALLALITTFSYVGGSIDPAGNMHNTPLAMVNEDAGASVDGHQLNFGDEVLRAILAPNPQLGDSVRWIVLASRSDALGRLGSDRDYAAIVVPPDFSARVVRSRTRGPTRNSRRSRSSRVPPLAASRTRRARRSRRRP